MGVAMWFAASGSATFDNTTVLVAMQTPESRRILAVALMLIVAGVGFKLSLVPFHAWTPEAYAGASTPMTALLATVSKVAALGALLAVARPIAAVGGTTMITVAAIAALSMTVGNVMALRENDTLRFMGWSSVAQAGWVVLPLSTAASGAETAAASYLVIYVVGTLAVFVALTAVAHRQGRAAMTDFDGIAGLGRRQPWTGVLFALGLLVLAGLPPAVNGVLAKVAVLHPVADGRQWVLLVVAAFNAMLGVAVYLRWIWQVFASAGDAPARSLRAHPVHLALTAVALPVLVVVSLAPQYLFWIVD
jgi:NADH-quinone oxidoreductase subunit N